MKVRRECEIQLALEPRGVEVAAHVTRDYVEEYPGKALVRVDLTNCFLCERNTFIPKSSSCSLSFTAMSSDHMKDQGR